MDGWGNLFPQPATRESRGVGKHKKTDWQKAYIKEIREEMVREFTDFLDAEFVQGLALCESPIEEAMLIALRRSLELNFRGDLGETRINYKPCENWPEIFHPYDEIVIYPQTKVGKYRVDILINVARGKKSHWFVVECDGHDFHEKTKEQARRDRARDRWMQMHDLVVLRFTGSEIFKSPDDCADQVAECIYSKVFKDDNG